MTWRDGEREDWMEGRNVVKKVEGREGGKEAGNGGKKGGMMGKVERGNEEGEEKVIEEKSRKGNKGGKE